MAVAERMPGGIKLARTPMAASRLSLGGSPLHPSSPLLQPTALPITFQVSPPCLHLFLCKGHAYKPFDDVVIECIAMSCVVCN